MQHLPWPTQQRAISNVLHQRMLELVVGNGWGTALERTSSAATRRSIAARSGLASRRPRQPADRKGKSRPIAAPTCAVSRAAVPSRSEPPPSERLQGCGTAPALVATCALAFFKHDLGDFLDKQRDPVARSMISSICKARAVVLWTRCRTSAAPSRQPAGSRPTLS